jgi:putative redox protein
MAPQLLIGHSLGGAAVLKAAPQIESVRTVVTIGAPSDPSHVAHMFESDRDQIESSGHAEVLLAGRPFTITREFIDDIEQASLQQAQADYRGALLVLHAPLDATVGISNAQEIFMAARHPKSFVCLDGADHLLTRRHDAEYAADVISAWALKYLPPAALEKPQIDEGEVLAVERDADGYTQDLFAGQQHHLVSDEPVALGGSDLGPSPYQLLSAALASCTAITLRMYARLKGIGLDGVAVRVAHHKQHVTDCEDCGDHARQVDVFERLIRLDGDLNDAERKRMLQIANRCPVHNTLQKSTRVESRLLDE